MTHRLRPWPPRQIGLPRGRAPIIVPIPGVKRGETMRDSAGACDVVLTADDLAALTAAAPAGSTAGPRYAEAGMARVKL